MTNLAARAAVVAVAVLLSLSARVSAQVRPDTLRRDTARVDTVTVDSTRVIQDSVIPPKMLVEHSARATPSFAIGVWHWDQDALLREMATTVGDLLERVPGITTYRDGFFLQRETSVFYGGTAGRMEVVLDGYVLDPIASGTFDFAQLPLAGVESVHVERRLDVLRIEIHTHVPTDGRPNSRIEAGVGEPNVNLFRGLLLMPRLGPGPLGLAIERIDTDGYRREGADNFAAWAKWSYIHGRAGVQIEYLRNSLNRVENSPWPAAIDRHDIIVRGRAPIGPVVAELFAGQTRFKDDSLFTVVPRPTAEDSMAMDTIRAKPINTQWGARASIDQPYYWGEASVRFRDLEALPSSQFDVAAGVRDPRIGEIAGSFTRQAWRDIGGVNSYSIRAFTRPVLGFSAFGEISGGDRGATYLTFPDSGAFRTERSGSRFGAQFSRWGIEAGAALLTLKQDTVPSLGMSWDNSRVLTRGGDVRGWEFFGRTQLIVPWLTLEGSYTNWLDGSVWAYMPSQQWRAALQYHHKPLPSGNLEILARLETRRRGSVLMPIEPTDASGPTLAAFQGYDTVDGYLQIRVMDIRLFIRGENLFLEPITELPGRTLRQTRFMYGMKWNFWN